MTAYSEDLSASAKCLGAWSELAFFGAPFDEILTALGDETETVLPPATKVFAGLKTLQPDDVRVVILGQDPYPTPGHANGLAFSVESDVTPLPRSLSNIFKELADDFGGSPAHGDLSGWSSQGVLLFNTALTVRTGNAGSHAKIGWSDLTRDLVTHLADLDRIVWVLWGKHAQSFRPLIDGGKGTYNLVIESAHPSPLSARRGFFGSKPFSRINNHLKKHGLAPIDWTA